MLLGALFGALRISANRRLLLVGSGRLLRADRIADAGCTALAAWSRPPTDTAQLGGVVDGVYAGHRSWMVT